MTRQQAHHRRSDPVSADAAVRDPSGAARLLLTLTGWALVAGALGLWLLLSDTAPQAGLVLFHAGAPASGLIGAFVGDLTIAWPLDLTAWAVATAFLSRRLGGSRPWWRYAVAAVAAAIGLALILWAFVSA